MIAPLSTILNSPAFIADCKTVFGSAPGRRVLCELMRHRSPFDQRFIPDLRAADHIRGAQELVGVLVAHAELFPQPTPTVQPSPTPTHDHGQQH